MTHPLRILLVDDNLDAAELLAGLVQQAGHDAYIATDAYHALALVSDVLPDLAIVDIGLPDMDGYELATRIRALSECRLIALSGFTAETNPREKRVSTFDRHLTKPVDRAALLQLIAALA